MCEVLLRESRMRDRRRAIVLSIDGEILSSIHRLTELKVFVMRSTIISEVRIGDARLVSERLSLKPGWVVATNDLAW